MIKVTGIYLFIAENSAGSDSTMGTNPSGPITNERDEEGLVGMLVPGFGCAPLVVLDYGEDDPSTGRRLKMYRNKAREIARRTGGRIELIHFGETGCRHIEWIA